MKIARKFDATFFEGLREIGEIEDVAPPAKPFSVLSAGGRSIALCLAHATGQYHRFATAILADRSIRRSSYGEWCKVLQTMPDQNRRFLVPTFGLHVPMNGPCLLHAHGKGRPQCLTVLPADSRCVRVLEGSGARLLSREDLERAWRAAIDSSTVVTFTLGGEAAIDPADALLNLRTA